MVHISSSHETYIAEYKYIRDMCQQDRPKGITLQAYQQEYAWQKRAPGCRKVSKAEQQLLEEHYMMKKLLIDMEDELKTPGTAISQCILPPSGLFVFT